MPKSIGILRKHIKITMQNFRAIGASSFKLLRKQKLTTYTHTHTHIHTFSAHDFFFNVDHIYAKKIDNLHTHTHTHKHIHTFSADEIFCNVDHIYAKKSRNLTIDF